MVVGFMVNAPAWFQVPKSAAPLWHMRCVAELVGLFIPLENKAQ